MNLDSRLVNVLGESGHDTVLGDKLHSGGHFVNESLVYVCAYQLRDIKRSLVVHTMLEHILPPKVPSVARALTTS